MSRCIRSVPSTSPCYPPKGFSIHLGSSASQTGELSADPSGYYPEFPATFATFPKGHYHRDASGVPPKNFPEGLIWPRPNIQQELWKHPSNACMWGLKEVHPSAKKLPQWPTGSGRTCYASKRLLMAGIGSVYETEYSVCGAL